jgi:serine/threonine protein kinase
MAELMGVGSKIGGYRVKGLVGQGGMGAVYLAEEAETGGEVALKVLAPEHAESEEFRRRFTRESRYANSLNHPHIVRVRDVGEADGLLYMAMDYVRGMDLKLLLALEGELDAERAVSLLSQVANALDAVHASGLYHRDVKPGNVVVASGDGPEERDHCYLTDFGLSKNPSQDSRALTAEGNFVGTFYYTAPEQILATELDHRVDVYSLGCLLYECLTGEPPFRREREVDVLHAHIEEPPPTVTERRRDLPPGLDEVVAKAMAKKPEERYGTCMEMMESARKALAASPALPHAPVAGAAPAPTSGGGPLRLRLRVTSGNAQGTEILVEDELLIGRHAQDEGNLADDVEISRQHARISRSEGGYVIEDLGSTNGTFVNGRRISAPEPLTPGDKVEVGSTTLVVQVSAHPPTVETPPAAEPARPPTEQFPPPQPEALPPIPLRIDIDFAAREARLELEGEIAPVRLVYEAGRWRFRAVD